MANKKNAICSDPKVVKLISEVKEMPTSAREDDVVKKKLMLKDILEIAEKTMPKSDFSKSKRAFQSCAGSAVQERKLWLFCEDLLELSQKKPSGGANVSQAYRPSAKQGSKTETLSFSYAKVPSDASVKLHGYVKRLDPDDLDALAEKAKKIHSETRGKDFANAIDFLISKRKETDRRFSNVRVLENAKMAPATYNRAKQGEDTPYDTVWQIILGLHCDESEAEMLMDTRGYRILKEDRYDAVMLALIRMGIYEVEDVNAVLCAAKLENRLFPINVPVKDETSGAEKPKRTRKKKEREPKEK